MHSESFGAILPTKTGDGNVTMARLCDWPSCEYQAVVLRDIGVLRNHTGYNSHPRSCGRGLCNIHRTAWDYLTFREIETLGWQPVRFMKIREEEGKTRNASWRSTVK